MKRLLYVTIVMIVMLTSCTPAPVVAPAKATQAPAAPQGEKVVLKYWNGFTCTLTGLPWKPWSSSSMIPPEYIQVQTDIQPWDSLFQVCHLDHRLCCRAAHCCFQLPQPARVRQSRRADAPR